jgi:mevalonate kinase
VYASAPGKVILCGEHAVVFSEPAIVMAINRRAFVCAELRNDNTIHISSKDLNLSGDFTGRRFKSEADESEAAVRLRPIWVAARKTLELSNKNLGVNVFIHSEIPPSIGLGSSAAVAVATVAAVGRAIGLRVSREEICSVAHEAEKIVHGQPSGIDTSISTYGGVIAFRRNEGFVRLKTHVNLSVVIGNTKIERSTGDLVRHVYQLRELYPNVINPLIHAIGHISVMAAEALRRGNLSQLGDLMNINHGLLVALGVSHEKLDQLVAVARRAGALGAKLTGAGGGGCMIALTTPGKTKLVAAALSRAGGDPLIIRGSAGGVRTWVA